MKRRDFFKAAGAVPLLGMVKPAAAKVEENYAWMATRDLPIDETTLANLDSAAMGYKRTPTSMQIDIDNDAPVRLRLDLRVIPVSPLRSPYQLTVWTDPRSKYTKHLRGRWTKVEVVWHIFDEVA